MDLSGTTDERLMQRVAAGDTTALEILMRRWHCSLHAFILHQGGAEPEDLYQETWIKVVRAAGTFEPTKSFRAWLFRIVLNVCRDAHRASEARPRTVGIEAAADIPAQREQPDTETERLRECMAGLPTQDREILSLRYYQGMTEMEVAGVMGIPVGTVKSRAHAAVAKLRETMKGNGHG